ncbi:MAG: hypothetical protein HRU20_09080 [Pseudomonadales bacterium]|nr:hypothetical protein [Pseudomonadales bacterium]
MQSIFFKIYTGLLLAAMVVGLGMYNLSTVVNTYRLESYVEKLSDGIFVLVANNIADKPRLEQREWLASVEHLTGLSIVFTQRQNIEFSSLELLALDRQETVVHANVDQRMAQVFYALPNDSNSLLTLQVRDISEQLARVASLLVLNELQRHDYDGDERQSIFKLLQRQFHFKMDLLEQQQLKLDFAQQRLLDRREVVVSFDEKALATPALMVYAPTLIKEELLVLGPISVFDWAPRSFIYAHVLLGFILLGFSLYLLLRPLQQRIQRMGAEIEDIDLTRVSEPMTVEGRDMLSLLSIKVNVMAKRIHSLMKVQRELTQAVSHELRTPIARMKFHLVLMDKLLGETEKKHLKGLQSDTQILERLVDEILTYANLEQERPHLTINEFDLTEELKTLIDETTAIRPEITIHLENSQLISHVSADKHYMLRACQNLLVNAQRHAHSQVRVVITQNKNAFQVSVHDDGEGISEEEKQTVFEPFKRLDSSRNRKSGGYGLGLAIVYQVMRWHQGEVEIYDSHLGGCEFRLCWKKGLLKSHKS